MRLTLVRHATLLLELGGKRLLVDPMLGDAGAYPPVENTPNPVRNPLVPLPQLPLDRLDALLVTHLHNDHWDAAARERLPKELPVLTQPPSAGAIRDAGFADVRPVAGELEWEGIRFARTGGRHGHGAVADALAPVSGFVLRASGEPLLYLAGDTVWCDEVEAALAAHRPDVAVMNAGGARFLDSEPITMDAADVARVAERVPRVVAVHLDAVNHCVETRAELRAAVPGVAVPADGETLEF
ncbi:MAG TPA: MBL fold metallo-hydrolase [Gaiellaceae bacterium]|nr:MBL fold metallo-hydrolase [Gaiellaceae bacterium]